MWGPLIKRWLHELLPDDAATVCSGRVGFFSLAVWPPLPRRVFVSEFDSKEDLIEAAMASVHIPYFLDGRMTCVHARAYGVCVLTRHAAAASAASAASTAVWLRGATWWTRGASGPWPTRRPRC